MNIKRNNRRRFKKDCIKADIEINLIMEAVTKINFERRRGRKAADMLVCGFDWGRDHRKFNAMYDTLVLANL